MKKSEVPIELRKEIELVGEDLRDQLEQHFEDHQAGLEYAKCLNKYAKRANKHGIGLTKFANLLQLFGYIKYVSVFSGKRMVFSGDCPWTKEEMTEWFQTMEMARETERDFKKINKHV